MSREKGNQKYLLCRTTTSCEYCDVVASSVAEAKRRGWPQRRVHVRTTKWHVIDRCLAKSEKP